MFRLKIGNEPPAKVQPMKIRIEKNTRPVKVKARRYDPWKRAFIESYTDQLVEMGFFVKSTDSVWQSSTLMLRNPASNKMYRLTIDLRPGNASKFKEA